MDATVVVPTHNRATLLRGALESLARQTLARERFEVVVVDNASGDDTAEVAVRALAAGALEGRCVREEALGLNHARNRGIAEARGGIIAFLDDDARAGPGWLEALLDALSGAEADAAGGRIDLEWESPAPAWIHRNHEGLLAGFDLGRERRRVDRYPFLIGTNLAVRAATLDRLGGFHPDLDRRGGSLLSAGDTELCRRIVDSGGTLLYEPRAVVRHLVPAERVTLRFLVRRSFDQGRSVCLYQRISGARDRAPSRPSVLARWVARVPWHLLRGDLRECARAVTTAAWHLGYLREARSAGRP